MVRSTTALHIKQQNRQANFVILAPISHRYLHSTPYIILREAIIFMHIPAFDLGNLGLNLVLIFILPFAAPTDPPDNCF